VLDTAFGTLSAKLGGQRLALATVVGLSRERHGFAIELHLRRLTLTRSAAAAIDASLGIPGLVRPGQALASATAVSPIAHIPVIDGRTYLVFGEMFFEKLKSLRVTTKPLGNAWLGGTSIAIPDTVGNVSLDSPKARSHPTTASPSNSSNRARSWPSTTSSTNSPGASSRAESPPATRFHPSPA
jgi:hypothetical protein